MESERVYRAIRAVPFRRFRLLLPGAEEVAVHDPRFAGPPPGGRTLVVHPPGRAGLRMFDVGRIVGMTFVDPAADS